MFVLSIGIQIQKWYVVCVVVLNIVSVVMSPGVHVVVQFESCLLWCGQIPRPAVRRGSTEDHTDNLSQSASYRSCYHSHFSFFHFFPPMLLLGQCEQTSLSLVFSTIISLSPFRNVAFPLESFHASSNLCSPKGFVLRGLREGLIEFLLMLLYCWDRSDPRIFLTILASIPA